jgi:[ribosomal protein S5]-alanine N-acetyltransferase
MAVELHTKRLLLRPLQLSDAEPTRRLFPLWDIVKFLNSKVPWPYPPDRVLNVYRNEILPGIERGEEWHWTLATEGWGRSAHWRDEPPSR